MYVSVARLTDSQPVQPPGWTGWESAYITFLDDYFVDCIDSNLLPTGWLLSVQRKLLWFVYIIYDYQAMKQ